MYKKPSFFSYEIGRIVAWYYNTFKLHNRFIKNELKKIKGPAVVLGNHTSSYDQFIACLACRKRMTFVLSDAMYYTLPCFWFISGFNVIHKQQFFTSVSDIKNMKEVVQKKGILMLYPAGVVPSCGKSTNLPNATGKFLKMLQADVYIIKEHGMYLSNPKWQKEIRTGKPETEVFRLFKAEELKSLLPSDILTEVSEALYYNDYEWQESKLIEYKGGSNINGLENVLHSCPVCGARFSIENVENTLKCKKCGFSTRASNYGFLDSSGENAFIKHPVEWEKKLHDALKQSIIDQPEICFKSHVSVKKLDKNLRKFCVMGDGILSVDRNDISVVLDSGNVIYSEKTSHFPILPMIPGEYLDLQDGITVFRCFPEEKKDVVFITDVVTCFFEINSSI